MTDKEKYIAYERVRRSGVTNMFDIITVEALSGLDRKDIIWVMDNYTELNKKYSDEYEGDI